jgi:hypothetical protein
MSDLARNATGMNAVPVVATDRVRISSRQVPLTTDGAPPDTDFLNSFFLEDLAAARSAVQNGDIGAALAAYLTPDEEVRREDRVDVREHLSAVLDRSTVDRMPLGRWPSPPGHPLALSQQFAVNHAFGAMGTAAGLLGVNGPPGTGKTTMLRDLVAANVVERARRLAGLDHPEDAFTDAPVAWKTGNAVCRVRRLRAEIAGFEIVVASSNNAAVENISNELPAFDAIDERWWGRADYYSDVATEVLHSSDAAKRDANADAWGLIATRLGNSHNRSRFSSAFWFDHRDRRTDPPQGSPGMLATLRNARQRPASTRWPECTEAFRCTEARVRALLAERRQAEQRIADLARTEQQLAVLPLQIAQLRQDFARLTAEARAHAPHQTRANADLGTAHARRARHYQAKPGILENFFSFGKAGSAWRATLAELDSALYYAEQQHAWISQRAKDFRAGIDGVHHDLTRRQRQQAQ